MMMILMLMIIRRTIVVVAVVVVTVVMIMMIINIIIILKDAVADFKDLKGAVLELNNFLHDRPTVSNKKVHMATMQYDNQVYGTVRQMVQ